MKTTSANTINHRARLMSVYLMVLVGSMFVASPSFAKGGGGGKLTFKGAKLISGTAGADGAVYLFSQVDSDLDAIVTIKGRSNSLVYLKNIDMSSSGFDKAWQPEVGYNGGTAPGPADWYMEFEVLFVEEGTTQPAVVEEFNLSAIDIDGNGHLIREYVSFYGLKSYIVESSSILAIKSLTQLLSGLLTTVGVRFDGPTSNFLNIDTSGTSVMTTAQYEQTDKFTVRTGGVSTGVSGASDRMYSMYFQEFNYTDPSHATLPVNIGSFVAKTKDSKVELVWSTSEEINFSHFVVQRSTNGKDFSDAGMVMSNAHGIDYTYQYTELLRSQAPQIMYYRLKMVDIDGSAKYSAIRIIRNSMGGEVKVTAYPNPVVSEIRITIPSNWQDRKVVYDVVNLKGSIVKRHTAEHASQTETLQMSDMQAGIYVVRLTAGNETASQKIIKN